MSNIDTIDYKKTAIVVIDLQEGIAKREGLAPYSGKEVVDNSAKLAKALKEKGGEVFLVRVSFTDGKDALHPALDPVESNATIPQAGWDVIVPELSEIEGAHVITKRQWGAFYGTELDLQLRRRGIDTIILCGIATGVGVDTTAREAFQRGYNQIFAMDAMTGLVKEEHEYLSKFIFPRMGKLRTTKEILDLMK